MSRSFPIATTYAWLLLLAIEMALFAVFGPSAGASDWAYVVWAGPALTAVCALCTLPLEWTLGKRQRIWIGGGALATITLALNHQAFCRGYYHVPLGAAGALMIVTAWAAYGMDATRRLYLWLAPLLPIVLSYANRVMYPQRYLEQHMTLSLLSFWTLALWATRLLEPESEGPGKALPVRWAGAGGLLLALLSFTLFGTGRAPLDAAVVLTRELPTPAAVASLLAPLADRDRDGFGSLLVGSDCDDRNPAVNPASFEIPGNGIDDNCVGGDAPLPQASAAFDTVHHSTTNEGRQTTIVLITVDALRADRVYGEGGARVAPFMHSLAQRCVAFEAAYATYATTTWSVFGLLHSRYATQAEERGQCGHFDVPGTSQPSLPGVLRDGGWETVMVAGTWLLSKKCGLTRDFGEVVVDPVELFDARPRAAMVTDLALAALSDWESGFLWVHYIDPHEPYWKGPGPDGPGGGASDEEAYDWEISHVDREIQRLFEAVPEDALIVLAADHGERFLRGNGIGHLGTSPGGLHVPLAFCGPGISPARVDSPVSLLDLAPTLLELAGLPAPASFLGESLVPVIRGQADSPGRGWAAAEYLGWPPGDRLERALFGAGFSIHADLKLGIYTIQSPAGRSRTAYLEPDLAGYDAWVRFADGHLGVRP